MRKYIQKMAGQSSSSPLLIIFPHSGGDPNSYRMLAKILEPYAEVWGICYPGRSYRFQEDFALSVPEIVSELADEFEGASGRSLVLFGHSLGGIIAYEFAKHLETRALHLQHLVISAVKSPDNFVAATPFPIEDDVELLSWIRNVGGLPAALMADHDMFQLYLEIIRADLNIYNSYQESNPHGLLMVPLTCFHGLNDSLCSGELMTSWGGRTRGEMTTRSFPGGHFYIGENIDEVATCLRKIILSNLAEVAV